MANRNARSPKVRKESQENDPQVEPSRLFEAKEEWDAVKIAKAVRALLRKQAEPGSLSSKEIRLKLEAKLGLELKTFKDVIKEASIDFVLRLSV